MLRQSTRKTLRCRKALRVNLSVIEPLSVQQAARVLRDGGVIAYPTEAVWGLGCDPYNRDAIKHLLALKDRPVAKGVILVAADISQVEFLLADLSDAQRGYLAQTWPGPNTWLIPHRGLVSPWVSGEFDTVAVRVSAHPVVRDLCGAFGGPIVSTSANPAGAEPARTREQVQDYFDEGLGVIVHGEIGDAARPSQIRDLRTLDIVRP